MSFDMLEEFRWFHSHPEKSGEERGTTARIKEILSSMGIRLLKKQPGTGVFAEIGAGQPVIALRADIDGLPITEATGLDYASGNPGVMHACGHDFHTCALLGAAALLKARETKLCHAVRLIFQPSEETCTGAEEVIAAGGLEGVSRIFGLHVLPQKPCGTVFTAPGPVYAACDRLVVRIKGKGCHGAYPHTGIDVIAAASQLVSALQTVVSRSIDPMNAAVVSVTRFEAGSNWNTIPEAAELEGTVRTLLPETRVRVLSRIGEITEGIDVAFGTKTNVDWTFSAPPVINEERCTLLAEKIAKELGLETAPLPVSMGGEDFSFYLERVPGTFLNIGTGGDQPLHHPEFTADAEVLPKAADLMAGLGAAGGF